MKKLTKVESCIAWAIQHGYCFAQDAADEYGEANGRVMVEDDNTAMYNTRSWVDARENEWHHRGYTIEKRDPKDYRILWRGAQQTSQPSLELAQKWIDHQRR